MAIRVLLDTNVILGLLKGSAEVARIDSMKTASSDECAYSAITRIELLGFPGIGAADDRTIRDLLDNFLYLPVTRQIEDVAIALRRQPKRVKLPDALILATAQTHALLLVTLDQDLNKLHHLGVSGGGQITL